MLTNRVRLSLLDYTQRYRKSGTVGTEDTIIQDNISIYDIEKFIRKEIESKQ